MDKIMKQKLVTLLPSDAKLTKRITQNSIFTTHNSVFTVDLRLFLSFQGLDVAMATKRASRNVEEFREVCTTFFATGPALQRVMKYWPTRMMLTRSYRPKQTY